VEINSYIALTKQELIDCGVTQHTLRGINRITESPYDMHVVINDCLYCIENHVDTGRFNEYIDILYYLCWHNDVKELIFSNYLSVNWRDAALLRLAAKRNDSIMTKWLLEGRPEFQSMFTPIQLRRACRIAYDEGNIDLGASIEKVLIHRYGANH